MAHPDTTRKRLRDRTADHPIALRVTATRRWPIVVGAVLLVAAVLVAYRGTTSFPFHFDDEASILENPSIRTLWPPWSALIPPPDRGLTVSGRPLLNLSLAVSHALSGEQPWGYHVLNLAIHAAAALLLFGIVRRTLLRLGDATPREDGARVRLAQTAMASAWMVSALWALHPLQTESVTYIVQRAESLVGLFYFATLLTFVRGIDAAGGKRRTWLALSAAACLAGMASKEVMASAPLIVLLYDRTFVAGSFAKAWRERRGYYLALATSWLLLAWLVVGARGRGGTVGFATPIGAWDYLTTQAWAVVRYLRLTLWPDPLIFDYGYLVITHPGVWVPCGLGVLALLGATAWALVRRPALGFLGAWFFAILGPTSSFIPIATQPVAEHRMYLPLAALATLVVVAVVSVLGRRGLAFGGVVALALGTATTYRNADYASVTAMWRDTIAKRPDNPRAHRNLGLALYHAGDVAGALAPLEEALRLERTSPEVHNYIANVLLALDRVAEAARHAAEAVRLAPDYGDAHNNYGVTLARQRQPEAAAAQFEIAARLMPRSASPRLNLANTRLDTGRPGDALPLLDEAISLEPTIAEAHLARGNALARLGRTPEAAAAFERAVVLQPTLGQARFALGNALVDLGRLPEAIEQLQAAVHLAPHSIAALNNLGDALTQAGRVPEAIAVFERALALDPTNPYLRDNLARLKRGR